MEKTIFALRHFINGTLCRLVSVGLKRAQLGGDYYVYLFIFYYIFIKKNLSNIRWCFGNTDISSIK